MSDHADAGKDRTRRDGWRLLGRLRRWFAAGLRQPGEASPSEIAETERTKAALQASEIKYKMLFDSSADAILLRDPDLRMIAGNRAAIALFGFKDENELAASVPAGVSPEHQPDGSLSSEKAKRMWAIATRKGSHSFEWLYRRKDGSEFFATVLLSYHAQPGDKPFLQTTIRDITQQKRAEDKLRESENRYRQLFEHNADALFIADARTRMLVDCNTKAEELTGYSREELLSMRADQLHPEDMLPGSLAAFEGFAKELLHIIHESVVLRKTGERVPVMISAAPVELEGQRCLVGVFHDISEQKRTEETLRESERYLQNIFDAVSAAIMVIDPRTHVVEDVNPMAANEIGLPREQIIGRVCHEFICPSAKGKCPITDLGQEVDHAERVCIRADGTRVPILKSVVPVTRNGRQYLLECFVNIAARKAAEKEREISAQRMESLLALSRMTDRPMQEIDAQVIEDAIRLTESEIGYLALANDDESVLTMTYWSRSAHADCRIDNKPLVYPVANTGLWGEAVRQRKPIITNDYAAPNPCKRGMPEGHVPLTRHMNIPVFDGQRIVAVAGVGNKETDYDEHDLNQLRLLMDGWWRIVKQRQYEQQLAEAKDEADAANLAKSRFLANMSHEIRTPMTAILGYADLLMDPAIDSASRNSYAATIRRSGSHLLTLINDILDLSKVEAGRMSVEVTRCDVVSLLAEVAGMLRPRAEQRGVSFSVEYPGEMPETILTDCDRLRQAVVNLAGNAVKFTERGSVRIVASLLPHWRGERPAVRFEVIDTGIGIREAAFPRLFQPFSQGDEFITQRFGGTGLGLAISRHIAILLGGDLTVKSVLGQGSTFTLTVPTGSLDGVRMLPRPAEVEHETVEQAWQSTPEDLRGVRILLAEDGYDNRELIRVVLQKAGVEVECVENGRLAVDRAEAEPFDLILMDMNMPVMDGYEATRLLRAKGYDRPIFALTANAMSDDIDRCLAAGCNEYLAKPIDRARLIGVIAACVGRGRIGRATV